MQALGLEVVVVRPVSLEDLRSAEWAATSEKRQLEGQVRPARHSLVPALRGCTGTPPRRTTIQFKHILLVNLICDGTLGPEALSPELVRLAQVLQGWWSDL